MPIAPAPVRLRPRSRALAAAAIFAAVAALPAVAGADEAAFSFTGAPQSWTVPSGVHEATFALTGGSGGASGGITSAHASGGRGALVHATLPVSAGQQLAIYVGGAAPGNGIEQGGWNGGGGGARVGNNVALGGGGGGASDVRVGGTALTDRVLVAGGGGGGGSFGAGPGPFDSGGAAGGVGGDAGTDGAVGMVAALPAVAGGGGGGIAGDAGGAGGHPAALSGAIAGSAGGAGTTGTGAAMVDGSAGASGSGGGGWIGGGSGATGDFDLTSGFVSGGSGGGGGGASYVAPTAADATVGLAASFDDGSLTIAYVIARPESDVDPTISGVARVGETLTCDPGGWSDANTVAAAWARDATPVGGADGPTYVVADADAGHALSCVVTAANGAGSTVVRSAPVAIPSAPADQPPANGGHARTPIAPPLAAPAAAPASAGLPTVVTAASALRCAPGIWTGAITLSVRWLRDGFPIPRATGATHQLTDADAAHVLQCEVTARGAGGTTDALSVAVNGPARLALARHMLFRSRGGIVGVPVTCLGRRCSLTVTLRRGRTTLAVRRRVALAAGGEPSIVHVRVTALPARGDRVTVALGAPGFPSVTATRALAHFG